ncbi:uncharacterized protein N7484_005804 [Penicillium longicatenatum]|uniref:uncharacterized protein n=1 Tax=Penicillium longicatenatum TaxID=1561947 RepID=UPI0025475724|nr:uncharacterized protein N7484_005804 [Penicillium longicatenatum]KAJ5643297.1 hypothetical protein N7484_005804 [Penicillium longicatenatum]
MRDWKTALMEVKRLYLLKQTFLTFYAAICYELLGRAAHIYSANKVFLLCLALENYANCAAALPPLVNLPRLPKVSDDFSWPPTPVSVEESLATFEPAKGIPYERESMMLSITRMIDASISGLDDPFLDTVDETYDSSPSRLRRALEEIHTEALKPRPLLIRKASGEVPVEVPAEKHFTKFARISIHSEDSSQTKRKDRFRPPRLPLKVIPSSRPNARMSESLSPKSELSCSSTATTAILSPMTPNLHVPYSTPPSTQPSIKLAAIPIENLTPTHAAQIVRSNRGIAFLREQVTTSIFEIRQQVRKVENIQDIHRNRISKHASSFWSFDPILPETEDNKASHELGRIVGEFGNILIKETIDQRIMRLRAEGWDTVGLRSSRSTWKGSRYYQELCAMVLMEQKLDSWDGEMRL